MRGALLAAGSVLLIGGGAASAQTVGVSAVVVRGIDATPLEVELSAGPRGLEVKTSRTASRADALSLLLERVLLERPHTGTAEPVAPESGSAEEPGALNSAGVRATRRRVTVTRIVAVNA